MFSPAILYLDVYATDKFTLFKDIYWSIVYSNKKLGTA